MNDPTSGHIYFGGKDVTKVAPEDREIGLVFQNYALYPHMTVADNIMFPLINRKVPKAEARERAQEMAKLVQLDHQMDRKPKALSGGQQQRVAIARALVKKPEVLLLDHMNIPYMNIGIGGHSRPYYLRTMLDAIAPHILVPLHSFRPEQVNTAHADKRILPEYGECFAFENGEMILKKN